VTWMPVHQLLTPQGPRPTDPHLHHPGTFSQSISEDCAGSNGWVPSTPITCPAGYVISSITSATFGRPSGSGTQNSGSTAVCYNDGPTLNNGNSNCYFEDVASMAAAQCIGQEKCSPNFQVDKCTRCPHHQERPEGVNRSTQNHVPTKLAECVHDVFTCLMAIVKVSISRVIIVETLCHLLFATSASNHSAQVSESIIDLKLRIQEHSLPAPCGIYRLDD
jgi:hypothetical protein